MDFLLWHWELLIAGILGCASHWLLFIRGELDRYSVLILSSFMVFYCITFSVFILQEPTLINAALLTTLVSCMFLTSLATSIAVYRLALHRLKHFPGSERDAVTKWSAVRQSSLDNQYHHTLARLHAKFGDYVRTGPMELSIIDARAWEILYGDRSPCTKGPWYSLGSHGQNLHRTRDILLHDLERPIWDEAFTKNALKDYAEAVDNGVRQLIDHIDDHLHCNITEVLDAFSFDNMCMLTFSDDVDSPVSQDTLHTVELLSESQRLLGTFGHVPWVYGIARYIPFLLRANSEFTHLASRKIERRQRRDGSELKDLFSYLLPGMSEPNSAQFPLEWEARLAMVVGSVNLSGCLTAACFYLAKQPDVLSTLQAEIDPVFDNGTFDATKPLPFLDSIVKESLRLQPLTPSGLQRKTPRQGVFVDEVYIPGNTICRIPPWVVGRSERNFVHPTCFIPERWTTRANLILDMTAYKPFGSGRYRCVGEKLAMMQIRTALANLANSFNWKFHKDVKAADWELSGMDFFTMRFKPLELLFSRRKRSH